MRNVSAATLDLSDVRFTKGVNFDFAAGTQLAAGANILVVNNIAAFNYRYGAGKPIAGAWQAGDILSNGGEEVKLSFGAGTQIIDFTYNDAAPWPTQADGQGYSLVRVHPENLALNPNVAANWRASLLPGGSPGGDDRPTFSAWGVAHGGITDPLADPDFDGLANLLEYALGGNPSIASRAPLPVSGVSGGYLTLSFRRLNAVEDISYIAEFSTDLASWPLAGVFVSSADNGDGTSTELWRAPVAMSSSPSLFARLRVVKP